MNRSNNFIIIPDNITISLDGHIRLPLSLTSMYDMSYAILLFLASSIFIPYMTLFLQHTQLLGVLFNNFFNPYPAMYGMIGWLNISFIVVVFKHVFPNSCYLFLKKSISTFSEYSTIE